MQTDSRMQAPASERVAQLNPVTPPWLPATCKGRPAEAGPTGLPQLSGQGAAPGGAASPMDALGPVIQQLVAAITQATGKPPTPQMLQVALQSLVGNQGGQGGSLPGAPAPMAT